MITRDHAVWSFTFAASVLAFVAASTHLIPDQYATTVQEIAAVLGFIAGKLGNSPLQGR